MYLLGKLHLDDGYSEWDCERFHHEDPTKDINRSAFEIDKARIIHSASFRRLQGKTQVLGVGARDFYRTRLTHSLEVAQIGRGLTREAKNLPFDFKINADLVEAICLAHDIGHPAFGHFGESTLHTKLFKHGGFGANPQNLRLVTFIESKHQSGGLNLCRAALDGLIKYSEPFDGSAKFERSSKFTYREDADLVKDIKGGRSQKSLEAQIADWSDTVAYSVDDIEDTFRAELLDFFEMKRRADEISTLVKETLRKKELPDDDAATGPDGIATLAMSMHEAFVQPQTLRLRKQAIKRWTSQNIARLIRECEIFVRDPKEPSNRYKYGLRIPDHAQRYAILLKAIGDILVFSDPRVKTLEYKGGVVIGSLYETFVEDKENSLVPLDFKEMIEDPETIRKHGPRERLIADFLAGMTDQYAFQYHRRLFLPGAGSFYEAV